MESFVFRLGCRSNPTAVFGLVEYGSSAKARNDGFRFGSIHFQAYVALGIHHGVLLPGLVKFGGTEIFLDLIGALCSGVEGSQSKDEQPENHNSFHILFVE